MIKLDANESPFNMPDSLYPIDSDLKQLKEKWGQFERIPSSYIYICNGTEESVDLCIRLFAEPNSDEILSVSPTRSIYKKRALVNRVSYKQCPLNPSDFSLNSDLLLKSISSQTKIILLCSPNAPTGNLFAQEDLLKILTNFKGLLIIDESYIDFCLYQSNLTLLNKYKNLILIRSFSHGWSSAGIRMSALIAHPDVISQFEQFGLTHPLNSLVILYAKNMLDRRIDVHKWVRQIVEERNKVILALKSLPLSLVVFPSEANFVFVKGERIFEIYKYLLRHEIFVKYTDEGLRISIGMPRDNSVLLAALRTLK